MKKKFYRLVIIFISAFSILVCISGCNSNNIENNNSKNETTETKIVSNANGKEINIPSSILEDSTAITNQLDYLCNSNGAPLDLERTNIDVNQEGNFVIKYNLKNNNTINSNKVLYFTYNKSSKIQTIAILFNESPQDGYQLTKMIEYMLQIPELHIPVKEANDVYALFNNPEMERTWENTINGRTYSWIGSSPTPTFMIKYNY